MDKKTIKAILDVVKDVSDRPGLYGAEIDGKYVIFTDGYVVVRLTMGEYFNLRKLERGWVSGEQLKETYKNMNAKDVILEFKDDKDCGVHPDWGELWTTWSDAEQVNSATAIRPDTFKKLAPFGDMIMSITENKMEQRLIKFEGNGVTAFACPLKGY